jgi:hypothetical protein
MDNEQNHQGLPLTNEQRMKLNAQRISFELSPFEIVIIKALRSYDYGQFVIHLVNGMPLRYTLGASYATDPTKDIDLLKDIAKLVEEKK